MQYLAVLLFECSVQPDEHLLVEIASFGERLCEVVLEDGFSGPDPGDLGGLVGLDPRSPAALDLVNVDALTGGVDDLAQRVEDVLPERRLGPP